MHQLEPEIRHAVLGNAGTIISFRVGAEDALEDVQRDHIAPSDMATWPPKFLPKTF
jgi:hypothetical protein